MSHFDSTPLVLFYFTCTFSKAWLCPSFLSGLSDFPRQKNKSHSTQLQLSMTDEEQEEADTCPETSVDVNTSFSLDVVSMSIAL